MENEFDFDNQNIFRYTDYRSFLNEYHSFKKRQRTNWSFATWSRHLQIKSPSTLIMILNGQRNPGKNLVEKLTHYFQFNARQSRYFHDLVQLQKHKNDMRLSVLIMEKLGKAHPSGTFTVLDHQSFMTISHWYHYAIREMTTMEGFQCDPHWISEKLNFRVDAKEVERAIERLINVQLLKRQDDGALRVDNGEVFTGNDVHSEGLKRFHEQSLEHAAKALRDIEPDLREISGVCFPMNIRNIEKAKNLIREFRKEFCNTFEENQSDAVYQLEVALFPLTKV